MENTSTSHRSEKPEWWKNNQRVRTRMELPEYEPPRFDDGAYKHDIVPSLEEEFGCRIVFRSKNPEHPCEWDILVDGEKIGSTGRRRTDHGNTIYQLSSEEFVQSVRGVIEGATEP